jgi:uncharacterized cupredoxin-like copper-binding protein
MKESKLKQHSKRKLIASLLGVGALALARGAAAHTDKPHAAGKAGPVVREQKEWGIAGDAKDARRTIDCHMLDTMRFRPELVEARLDETIRFSARNTGRVMHEFVIGTPEENAAHYELMKKFPNMEHDEPWMAHVPPGKRGDIVWKFNREGEFEFACLIAGHYEAGMRGRIVVRKASA